VFKIKYQSKMRLFHLKNNCKLRDSDKAYYIYKGCSRRWLNLDNEERKSSGIKVHWPDVNNPYFKEELKLAEESGDPNNISPIISYSMRNIIFVWMGDLKTEYMENIYKNISLKNITVLFAPHHGRKSGKIPEDFLKILNPKLVIIGEAPSKELNYYKGYNTITQNSAGDITFDVDSAEIDIYVSNKDYEVDFLTNNNRNTFKYYLGSLVL